MALQTGKVGNYRHGMSGTPTHRSWMEMKQRCTNPLNIGWGYYGGRGITFDPRWLKFENFLADMGERPAGMTLDRKNSNGPYTKKNCRWATPTEQRRGRRDANAVTFRGRTQFWVDWAKKLGVKASTLKQRFYTYGWSVSRTLTTEVR